MYLNGTTDRSYTPHNRQAVHRYGTITLLPDKGNSINETFKDGRGQMEKEKYFRELLRQDYKGKGQVYLTFTSRMDTNKARKFLDEVAEKVGFIFRENRLSDAA